MLRSGEVLLIETRMRMVYSTDTCLRARVRRHVQFFCDPMDCNLPSSSVHGILQARILEWVAMPPPGDLPNPGIEPESLMSSTLASKDFTTSTT